MIGNRFIVDGFKMNRGTSEEDLKYDKILRQIQVHSPREIHFREPTNVLSHWARNLLESSPFRVFSTLCILTNVGFMLADHADASSSFEMLMFLQSEAFFFEIVFENAVSMVGYGPYVFVYDPWKRFDVLIMLGSATSYFSPDSRVSTAVQVKGKCAK